MTDPSGTSAARDHRRLIDRLLADAAPGANCFAALLTGMAGAGPADVFLGLRRMRERSELQAVADALIFDAGRRAHLLPATDQPASLPLPHPLDSEWRFAPSSVDDLVGRLLDATGPGDELLLVGTPSVAAALSRTGADRRIRFVGPDDLVSAEVERLFAGDIRLTRGAGGQAAAAVVDPPWYGGPFAEMLAICARGCRRHAPVLTVMPRSATRPGMEIDAADMLASAVALGLEPTEAGTFEVSYRMPLFEARALERGGLRPDLGEWRRGDCVTLTSSGKAPGSVASTGRPGHVELMLDGCRIRLTLGSETGGRGLAPVEDEEVSASVSARSPTRRLANLWTTANRALRVDEGLCLDAFAAIAEDEAIVLPAGLTRRRIESSCRNGIEGQVNLIHSIHELFAREIADAARLVGDGSWLRGAKGMRCSSAWSGTSQPSPCGTATSASSSTAVRVA